MCTPLSTPFSNSRESARRGVLVAAAAAAAALLLLAAWQAGVAGNYSVEDFVQTDPNREQEAVSNTAAQQAQVQTIPRSTTSGSTTGSVQQVKESTACKAAAAVQLCSHRAALNLDGDAVDKHTATFERRLAVLLGRGVPCHDLDVVATSDGFLLVAHPNQLNTRLLEKNVTLPVEKLTLKDIYQALGQTTTHETFPLLKDALSSFRKLIGPDPLFSPLLFIELKASSGAMALAHLQYLAQQAQAQGLEFRIAVWFLGGEDIRLLESVRQQKLPLKAIRSYPDFLPTSQGSQGGAPTVQGKREVRHSLTPQDLLLFDMFGPSLKAKPVQLFSDISAAKRPMVMWMVDTLAEVLQAAKLGATHCVSNKPLELQAQIRELCKTH